MRLSSSNSSGSRLGGNQRSALSVMLLAGCWLLMAGPGCESLQKKFVRPGKPKGRLSPIIQFEDYTNAMTPLDRYRKHYALFDYWNAELLDGFAVAQTMNTKRAKKASAEALQELRTICGLVIDGTAPDAERMIHEREEIDGALQRGLYTPSQIEMMRRTLESQTRQIHRELFWRKVEDHLKEPASAPAIGPPSQGKP